MQLDDRQQRLVQRTFMDYQATESFLDNPIVVSRAEGLYYWDVEGKRYFDGLGGIFVEVLKDVTFRVAPIDEAEAERMIAELRGAPLLAGVRGRPPSDIPALAKALAALSRFAAAHGDTLESAELNPVVVRPTGEGLAALDALVVPKATKD